MTSLDPEKLRGLDFETYATVNLPKAGLENYVRDEFFRPLIASVAAQRHTTEELDFVRDYTWTMNAISRLANSQYLIVAHNAPFERRVLRTIGYDLPASRFIDSAVIARAAGAHGSLASAAPQLVTSNKIEEGWDLIKRFSIPHPDDEDPGAFDPAIIYEDPDKWDLFQHYCNVDAELSLRLAIEWGWVLTDRELTYAGITDDMNVTGWHVDVPVVEEMQRRYQENLVKAEADFRTRCDEPDLNLGSLQQLQAWCSKRGVTARSFDKDNVARMLKRIEKRLEGGVTDKVKREGYEEVVLMLQTKQILGGSSLKKLAVILENTTPKSRAHDQYLHVGAGQTWRTTGRTIQMQNLKRIGEPADMDNLFVAGSVWSNDQLAKNLRQVFCSEWEWGHLIVGDFSSVESRGLAYQAGAKWKLDAFRQGMDMYKIGAAKQFSVAYDAVTKDQRQFGKVGELGCGYQAGGPAVRDFAAGMGVEMSEGEAVALVNDWRLANPEIVDYWAVLDAMIRRAIELGTIERHDLPYDDLVLYVQTITPPDSLQKLNPSARTLSVYIEQRGEVVLRRFFHGCYMKANSIVYYKPSQLKSGDLWKDWYIHPKTKQKTHHTIYGGKLAGILTQSLCREIFFRCLAAVHTLVEFNPHQLKLIGQFHDEIVLDFNPAGDSGSATLTLDDAKAELERLMSRTYGFHQFPMAAEVKHDYRYTK